MALLLLLAAITLTLQARSQSSLRLLSRLTTDLHDRAAKDALTDLLRGPIAGAMASPTPLANRPLDGMGGFISAISYNLWAQPALVTYASGVTETMAYSPDRGRLTQIIGRLPDGISRFYGANYTRTATGRIRQYVDLSRFGAALLIT